MRQQKLSLFFAITCLLVLAFTTSKSLADGAAITPYGANCTSTASSNIDPFFRTDPGYSECLNVLLDNSGDTTYYHFKEGIAMRSDGATISPDPSEISIKGCGAVGQRDNKPVCTEVMDLSESWKAIAGGGKACNGNGPNCDFNSWHKIPNSVSSNEIKWRLTEAEFRNFFADSIDKDQFLGGNLFQRFEFYDKCGKLLAHKEVAIPLCKFNLKVSTPGSTTVGASGVITNPSDTQKISAAPVTISIHNDNKNSNPNYVSVVQSSGDTVKVGGTSLKVINAQDPKMNYYQPQNKGN